MEKSSISTDIREFMKPIRQYRLLALSLLLLVLAFTLVKGLRSKKYYRFTFFITCELPLVDDVRLAGDKLKSITEVTFSQAEMKALAGNFQLASATQFSGLKNLTVNTIRTVKENNASEVVLEVYDTAQAREIITAFLGYLNRNSFLSVKLEKERKRYQLLADEIDKQLRALSDEGRLLQHPETFINLLEKREGILARLDKFAGFEVSVPPAPVSQPANMSLLRQMILALVWGSILSLLIAFLAGIMFPRND
ncbi:MAG TPA: hypothetical protein P5531_08320 [Bacteroidales bacterium]|nr:hypothetical protein [Bacteroidales bacterium]HSA43532.1 hypothetical protein [Bacteroidales bacterium]